MKKEFGMHNVFMPSIRLEYVYWHPKLCKTIITTTTGLRHWNAKMAR